MDTIDTARETAKELARNLPSADDIIRALGLRAYRRSSPMSQWALFGAGILVGAGLALLFAPTSGRELREELGERAEQARGRIGEAAEQASESLASQAGQAMKPPTQY
jgi:hypothetical protein